jgi:hypothetical protein
MKVFNTTYYVAINLVRDFETPVISG